jgi:hypothetical protein
LLAMTPRTDYAGRLLPAGWDLNRRVTSSFKVTTVAADVFAPVI